MLVYRRDVTFLSTSLLGASRSYFFPPPPPPPPLLLLTLHEISLYFTLITQNLSLSLSSGNSLY